MKPGKNDRILVARYLDGELPAAERAACERRLATDVVLRAALDEAQQHAEWIRSVDDAPAAAPAGFAGAVLDSVRRMPAREELIVQAAAEESVGEAVTFARRVAMAAAVLMAVAMLFGIKAFIETDTDFAQASMEQELRDLDKKVKAMKMEDLRRQGNR